MIQKLSFVVIIIYFSFMCITTNSFAAYPQQSQPQMATGAYVAGMTQEQNHKIIKDRNNGTKNKKKETSYSILSLIFSALSIVLIPVGLAYAGSPYWLALIGVFAIAFAIAFALTAVILGIFGIKKKLKGLSIAGIAIGTIVSIVSFILLTSFL